MLRAEVDRLPEVYRNLVIRCYLEGWSNEEAAGSWAVPSA